MRNLFLEKMKTFSEEWFDEYTCRIVGGASLYSAIDFANKFIDEIDDVTACSLINALKSDYKKRTHSIHKRIKYLLDKLEKDNTGRSTDIIRAEIFNLESGIQRIKKTIDIYYNRVVYANSSEEATPNDQIFNTLKDRTIE